jgi:biotin operon repressor
LRNAFQWRIFQIPEYGITVELKPQDLLVLLKRAANADKSWTYAAMGKALGLSASQVHRSVQRVTEAGLAISKGRGDWHVVPEALAEFAVHGVRYAFPAKVGAVRRGIPTSFGASPLSARISAAPGEAPVWPYAEGPARGPALSPLYRHVPEAALADPALYELLALLDALRAGRSRERTLAQKLLSERLVLSRAA